MRLFHESVRSDRLLIVSSSSCNKLGAKMYPKGTNHLSPFSPLFKDKQSACVRASDAGGCSDHMPHRNEYPHFRYRASWDDVPALYVRPDLRLEGFRWVLLHPIRRK